MKLCQRWVRLDVRKMFFNHRAAGNWNQEGSHSTKINRVQKVFGQ